jgi:hypothetical protein
MRKQEFEFRPLPCFPQPELSLPSSYSSASPASLEVRTDQENNDGDDGDNDNDNDIPDLVYEDYNSKSSSSNINISCNNEDTPPRSSSWPAHIQPANLTSVLKKKNNKKLSSNHSGCTFTPSASSASSSSSSSLRKKRPTTQRRVRGLWNVDSVNMNDENTYSFFEELRDETLEHICSFLDLADLCRAGMVGRRWKSVVHNTPSLWKHIDATSFVQQAHQAFHQNMDLTGQAMESILKLHKPESLAIRDIHQSLSADTYLPSISSLKELTLTHYENLTDTHVHVMLLMTLKKQSNELRALKLEDCPRLTNASIRSITATCTNLAHLSLKGNAQMTDVAPLAPLLATRDAPVAELRTAPAAPPASLASFQAFFSPPLTPATPPRPPMTPPRQRRPSTPPPNAATSSLQSLFAPPGMSPPRKSSTLQSSSLNSGISSSSLSSSLLSNNNTMIEGKLQRLNLQGTKITAHSLLQCLKKRLGASNNKNAATLVANFTSLSMNGDTWTDALMGDFSQCVALEELEELSLAIHYNNHHNINKNKNNNKGGGGQLTNKGLKAMARNATPRFSKLHALNLSGQSSITGMGLASLVTNSASPNLETLRINHCHGVASDPKGMDRFAKALIKNQRLKSLHMRGCMSSDTATCNPALQIKELQCWQRLVEAAPELSIQYLDVRECWTTRTADTTTTGHDDDDNNNDNTNDVETLRSTVSTVLY